MKKHIPYLITLLLSCMTLVSCSAEIVQANTVADDDISSQAESTASCSETAATAEIPTAPTEETEHAALFSTAQDVGLYEVDGQEQTYAFLYNDETFYAVYTPENWKIIDSYRITNIVDMELICQALADVNPIHGADMKSYRTAKDMAHEWLQHNLAYMLLPADSPWKQSAKDVDINPADQGKNIYDFIKDRLENPHMNPMWTGS